jgi:hypothetical protein
MWYNIFSELADELSDQDALAALHLTKAALGGELDPDQVNLSSFLGIRREDPPQIVGLVIANILSLWYDQGGKWYRVEVGTVPEADSHRGLNNLALQALPFPFTGEVDAHQVQGPDGWVAWPANHEIAVASGGLTSAALEIGSVRPWSVCGRLLDRGYGVARWPYGETWLTLFILDWKQVIESRRHLGDAGGNTFRSNAQEQA